MEVKNLKTLVKIKWLVFMEDMYRIKRCIWNKRLLLWWYRLWVRRDEAHSSLSMDVDAMREMSKEESVWYVQDLVRRRNIAHERDLMQ